MGAKRAGEGDHTKKREHWPGQGLRNRPPERNTLPTTASISQTPVIWLPLPHCPRNGDRRHLVRENERLSKTLRIGNGSGGTGFVKIHVAHPKKPESFAAIRGKPNTRVTSRKVSMGRRCHLASASHSELKITEEEVDTVRIELILSILGLAR